MTGEKPMLSVLYLEEEAARRLPTAAALRALGVEVRETGDGVQAGQGFREQPPDLLLLNARPTPKHRALAALANDRRPRVPLLYLAEPTGDISRPPEGFVPEKDGFLTYPLTGFALQVALTTLTKTVPTPSFWRTAFDSVNDAMCVLHSDGIIAHCNEAMAALTETSVENLVGSHCADALHDLYEQLVLPALRRMQERLQRETTEVLYRGRWYLILLDPMPSWDGPSGAVLKVMDITDRKQVEEEKERLHRQVHEKSVFLDAVLAHAPEGIVVVDREARVVLSNAAANDMMGRPAPYGEPYEAHARMQLVWPDGSPVPPRQIPLVRAALEGADFPAHEISIIRPDGRRRDLLANVAPLRSPDGEPAGAIAVFQDITESKQMQRELSRLLGIERERAELSGLLEAVLDYTPSALGYLDRALTFVFVNPAFTLGSGRHRQELVGHSLREFPVGREMAELVERVRETGAPLESREYPFRFSGRKDQEVTYWDWFITPVREQGGEVQGILLSAMEVTDRVLSRQRLAEAEQQQEREARVLTTMQETAPCMVAYLDRELRYVQANSAYVAALELTSAAIARPPASGGVRKRRPLGHRRRRAGPGDWGGGGGARSPARHQRPPLHRRALRCNDYPREERPR